MIKMAFRKRKSFRPRYKKFARKFKSKASAYRRRLIKTIKSVAVRQAEPKAKDTSYPKVELYHNVVSGGYTLNSVSGVPTQGTSDSQRVGDQINVTGFSMRMLMGQKGDRPNVTFRWWVLKLPKGVAYSYASWFDATTNNVLLDRINSDLCKIIKTGVWRPNEAGLTATGNDEYTFVKKLWVPYKRTYKFLSHGGTSHDDGDIQFIIAAYDAYGSVTTDNIAYIQAISTLYYRDP